MTTSNEFKTRFRPRSYCDSIDGDNSKPGGCTALTNLIFDPATPALLACRPGVQQLSIFPGFDNPSIVSAGYQLNGIVYGLVTTQRFPGHDEPFAYDISRDEFLTVQGVTAANVPATQPASGDWIPPDAASLGPRIVITDIGFDFSAGYAFGFFDVSGFTSTGLGNTTNGSYVITGGASLDGINPGYLITGAGIPTGASVVDMQNVTLSTTGNLNATINVTGIADIVGIAVGQQVAGDGISTGTTVASIVSGTEITLSQSATTTMSGVQLSFTGATITMSAPATATANNVSITVSGGTAASPLWGAGNLGFNPLPTIPSTVGVYSDRFYFGTGNVLAWSDTLELTATSSDQAIFIGDNSPITALSPMSLATTSEAILEGFMIFKQNYIAQLTGDAQGAVSTTSTGTVTTSSTLSLQTVSEEIGTASPRSIGVCQDGLRFAAVDGVRLIQVTGVLTDPDADMAIPVIYALYPSRISGGFNNNTYRICVQNNFATGSPIQEYWYDMKRKGWTGPHTFPQDLILPYKNTFILFSNLFTPSIWESDVVQGVNDVYVEVGTTDYVAEDGVTIYTAEDGVSPYVSEDTGVVVDYVAEDGATPYITEDGADNYIAESIQGNTISWVYETFPMMDFDNVYANYLVNCTVEIALPPNGFTYLFGAEDESFTSITSAEIEAPPPAAIWGQFFWAEAYWGAAVSGLKPVTIAWPIPIVFNRLSLSATGTSSSGLKIGNFNMISKKLNYLLH